MLAGETGAFGIKSIPHFGTCGIGLRTSDAWGKYRFAPIGLLIMDPESAVSEKRSSIELGQRVNANTHSHRSAASTTDARSIHIATSARCKIAQWARRKR